MPTTLTTSSGSFEIHSEAHGPHWIAWIARGQDGKPERSIVLVGQTREEAEDRARRWADEHAARGEL